MKLNDISILKNGKKCKYDEDGQIPIYGSNGVIGYTDKSNSRKNSIVIGRVGANAGSVFFRDTQGGGDVSIFFIGKQ